MRYKSAERMEEIRQFIDDYCFEHKSSPRLVFIAPKERDAKAAKTSNAALTIYKNTVFSFFSFFTVLLIQVFVKSPVRLIPTGARLILKQLL